MLVKSVPLVLVGLSCHSGWPGIGWNTVATFGSQVRSSTSRGYLSRKITGLGKPEHLQYRIDNGWSRRIDKENRLVYYIIQEILFIAHCRFHYDK
ncbi:type II toxin-antitoxin system YoeB family toxin [Lactiplantibacillus dongliensis]|uniref:Endoribonuclease YoeB n=1 Tax=Lactiplantibacillus dongliensis TaxID=2559919 RepID=A0ABW1R6D0_9LACO|nr:type II toxin-antitoxin system YoeB family toxin [Lactiplantibacillus dongliensis]